MVITIVSYISQDDWLPWQAAEDLCVALWSPRFCHQLCCDEGSASVHLLYSVRISLCLCRWDSERVWSCSSMMGAGPTSESGLGLGDVDFDAVGAFCGGVLSYRRRSLRCHQSFPGLLPLLVHSRVYAPVLPRRQLGLWWLLWHGRRKLLVFILRRNQEGKMIKHPVVLQFSKCPRLYYTNRQ